MASFETPDRLDFYQDSKKGKMLRALTLNDVTFWATDAFIAVVLSLFVIGHIDGGSATHVGLGYLMYKGVAALLSIPIGRFFDKHRGHLDEVWGLAIANFVYGAAYIYLSFATQLWQLYLVMFILGCMSTVNLLSWRTLFFNTISKDEYTETVGTYQTMVFLCQGIALALGGLVGDNFGFDVVVLFGGIVIFCGGILPISIRYLVRRSS
jgi:predicted MFS family arabinose efflux permease